MLSRRIIQDHAQLSAAGRRLLAEIVRDCGATEATLWLIGSDGRHMDGVLNHGKTPDLLEKASVPVTDSVVGMVASSGIATGVGPGDVLNRSIDAQTGTPTRAMIASPVHVDDRLVGVVSAINPAHSILFGADALEMLQWKAYLLGLILAHLDD